MQVECPSCKKVVDAPDVQAGQIVNCPSCGGQMQLPAAAQEAAPPAPATAPARRCPLCAEPIQPEAVKCPHCQNFIDGRKTAVDRDGPDWERREELGFWPAVLGTIKGVLIVPAQTFERARLTGYRTALNFCFLTALVGMGGMVLVQMLVTVGKLRGGGGDLTALFMGTLIGAVVAVAIIVPLSLLMFAGLVHLMLKIMGAANEPYETTFRAVTYSFGGSYVLMAIPVCGSLIANVWGMVASIFAVAKMQRVSYGRAAAAVLVPFGTLFMLGVAIGVMLAISRHHA